MGIRDETVIFRLFPAGAVSQLKTVSTGTEAPTNAINWLMGRGRGVPDAMDGGVWASAISWLGQGDVTWPSKDMCVGRVDALLGTSAEELVKELLTAVFGGFVDSDVQAILEGELRVTNVNFKEVPEWYLSMNYVLTNDGSRRAKLSLVSQVQSVHKSNMGGRKDEYHEIAPDREVGHDAEMYRWLEQVGGMGLTFGLHTVLTRERSQKLHAVTPMFIVAGTAAISFGRGGYAAIPSADFAHEWVVLPVLRDEGLVKVKNGTLRSYETPRFLATVRQSTSSSGDLVLATSSLICSPERILRDSKAPSVGTVSDGPYNWDCTAYGGSEDPIRAQKLVWVDKSRGVEAGELERTTVLHTHAPGMVTVRRGTSLVYTPPLAVWWSLILDGASTLYAITLIVLTSGSSVSGWAKATFVIEILAEVSSRLSALLAWTRSPARDYGLSSAITAAFAPLHWVLRNPGRDAQQDGWLWRAPLRCEAWGALLSLGPLAASAALETATSYQVALLAVVSTVAVGSLRFTDLWEELIGLTEGQSSGVCASYALMYVCGLLVQSSFLVEEDTPRWALFGVVFGATEALTAVRTAVTIMKALESVDKGRGEALEVALASEGGLLGALTMSGNSRYGDISDWDILALRETDSGLQWSPARVSSVAGGDYRGLSFTEVNLPDSEVSLLCAHSEVDVTLAATDVVARIVPRPHKEAAVEVMPGRCSASEALRRSGVAPEYEPMLAVKVGDYLLPIATGAGT